MVRGFLMQSLSTGSDGLRWKPNLRLLRESLPAIGGFPQMEAQYDGPVLWIAGAESDYVDSDQHGDAMRELFPAPACSRSKTLTTGSTPSSPTSSLRF